MSCKRSAYGTPYTLTTKLFTVVSVLCTILLDHSQCSACTSTFESTVKFKNVRRDVNTGIVTSTHVTLSATQCSYKCTRNSSVSFYYAENRRECHCNSDLDINTGQDPSKPELVYGVYEKVIKTKQCDNSTTLKIKPDTMDCLDLHNKGFSEDGVYTIYPQPGTPVSAWCHMSDGGWTVMQRRMNGDEDFYRNWHDYKFGFGNPEREYWLGLENIHFLTHKSSEISIQMVTFGDRTPLSCISNYSHFNVYGESEDYRLSLLNFSGTCLDPLLSSRGYTSTNNKRFSTFDRDNDFNHEGNCAKMYHGAWWYAYCFRCNLNGIYRPQGAIFPNTDGIAAIHIWGLDYSLKETIMKFRRLDQDVDF